VTEGQRWVLLIGKGPEKTLRKLPRDLRERIDRAILALSGDPRPAGCKKLTGYADLYPDRVGDWRITYAVKDAELIVLVIEVALRGGAYRDL
jgi:mRNA interferase RelE/StbE